MPISDEVKQTVIKGVAHAFPKSMIVSEAEDLGATKKDVDALIRQYSSDIIEMRTGAMSEAGLDTLFDNTAILIKRARFAEMIELAILESFSDRKGRFDLIIKSLLPLWDSLVSSIAAHDAPEMSEKLEARILIERIQKAPPGERDTIRNTLIQARDQIAKGDIESVRAVFNE